MKITKAELQISIENLNARLAGITGKSPEYKLVSGDARLGKVYSIGLPNHNTLCSFMSAGDARLGKVYSIGLPNHNTLCSFMSAKELDAYIWGMYKAFDLLGK